MSKKNDVEVSGFRANYALVGGYLPLPIADRLAMYCAFYDMSKSAFISKAIETALLGTPEQEDMAYDIAERLTLYKRPKHTKQEYLTKMRQLLMRKKLNDDQINMVIEALEEQIDG